MKSTNKPQKTHSPTDKKKVISNVARDDGIEGPKGPAGPGKSGVVKPADPPETKKV